MRTTGAGRLVVRPGERASRPAQRRHGFVAVELAREDVIAQLPARARLGAAVGKLLARGETAPTNDTTPGETAPTNDTPRRSKVDIAAEWVNWTPFVGPRDVGFKV